LLVKLNTRAFVDDFGLLVEGPEPFIHMFENGVVRVNSSMRPVPVVKVKARWVDKDARLSCEVADTHEKKIRGLQMHTALGQNRGLFFPYAGPTDVTFHQGTVPFPLDIMFIREGSVIQIECNTKVGGSDRWSCKGCDSVIEVTAGFCKDKTIRVGDQLIFFAYSDQDIQAYEADRVAIQNEEPINTSECIASLASAIVGVEID